MTRWIVLFGLVAGCSGRSPLAPDAGAQEASVSPEAMAQVPKVGKDQAAIVLGGGCFWCIEKDFDKLDGVVHTTSGYAGGHVDNPTYRQVGGKGTGHVEVLRVVYDTTKLDIQDVLTWFWRHIDPTDGGGQFCDRGDVYRPAIFAQDEAQLRAAEASRDALAASAVLPGPIATEIKIETKFWPAENYHQDFYVHNPAHYERYRAGCRRDARVQQVWARAPALSGKLKER